MTARWILAAIAAIPAIAQTQMTATDVESFLDGLVPLQLQREDIAGATVAIVKDGKLLFAKGYGYANVADHKPVVADSTLFRPGSISKLFTWTSVMQLVEQHKLDLDRDVNDYLDFKIPAAFDKPVTLRNIMTHTPGFEEAIKNLFVPEPKDLLPLGDYLKRSIPGRVFPPGSTPAYSNYATALAGYIVQRVSGELYDDYVEHHIFQPLGMSHTSMRQPLPDALKPLMSTGYMVASKPPKNFEIVQAWPAGSASVTSTDMARFMIAHLQDGHFENATILQPETAQLMHSKQYVAVPPLNAMALGFYEETRNGHRIIGHGGDTVCFHSDLHLILDQNVGFFVSYNSAGKGEVNARGYLFEQFMDRYFPYQIPNATTTTAATDASEVAGSYETSRRPVTNVFSFITAASITKVTVNPDNTISFGDREVNGQPKHFREIAPMVFRNIHGQDRIAFKKEADGRMRMGVDYPFMVFDRAPWYESAGFNNYIVVGSVCIIALTFLLWPVGALIRWHYARPLKLTSGAGRRWLVRLSTLAIVLFAVLWVRALSSLNDPGALNDSKDSMFRLIQIPGWIGALLGLAAIYDGFAALAESNRWWFSRVHAVLLAASTTVFIWFVYHWHMLKFSLKF